MCCICLHVRIKDSKIQWITYVIGAISRHPLSNDNNSLRDGSNKWFNQYCSCTGSLSLRWFFSVSLLWLRHKWRRKYVCRCFVQALMQPNSVAKMGQMFPIASTKVKRSHWDKHWDILLLWARHQSKLKDLKWPIAHFTISNVFMLQCPMWSHLEVGMWTKVVENRPEHAFT